MRSVDSQSLDARNIVLLFKNSTYQHTIAGAAVLCPTAAAYCTRIAHHNWRTVRGIGCVSRRTGTRRTRVHCGV